VRLKKPQNRAHRDELGLGSKRISENHDLLLDRGLLVVTRLYLWDGWFNLAYFRHTGQFWEVAQLLTLEECLSQIESGRIFTP
jgi:hypothetical protein